MLPFMDSPADATPTPPIKRHAVVTRLWHWINAIAVFILIGSGLGISNAHPRLYWGEYGANFDHRSEEHTSELQSLMRISYAVFCLKKKKKQQDKNNTIYAKSNTTNQLNKTILIRSQRCQQQEK